MPLLNFQQNVLSETDKKNSAGYFLDMGLGKTFVGSYKAIQQNKKILVVCQLNKINDWVEHFKIEHKVTFLNLRNKKNLDFFVVNKNAHGVINYDLLFRKKEFLQTYNFILLLDESSVLSNANTKRREFISKLKYTDCILLSGTPSAGRYEKLWSQLNLIGWNIPKKMFWDHYINYTVDYDEGYPITTIHNYKNIDRLKQKLNYHNCVFLDTKDVYDLPNQKVIDIDIDTPIEYKKFKKTGIVTVDLCTFIGDMVLTKRLYERILCGAYNQKKLETLKEILESTEKRIIVFYNFDCEFDAIKKICIELNKPIAVKNGKIKDDSNFALSDCIYVIQYAAGSRGVNLQEANYIIYFVPPESSDLYEQSKKRIHRIGQKETCFYYRLICKNSIETKIYEKLEKDKKNEEILFKNT